MSVQRHFQEQGAPQVPHFQTRRASVSANRLGARYAEQRTMPALLRQIALGRSTRRAGTLVNSVVRSPIAQTT
jgi:hypothetical protein